MYNQARARETTLIYTRELRVTVVNVNATEPLPQHRVDCSLPTETRLLDHHNGYDAMASQRRRCWPLQRRDSNATERSRQAYSQFRTRHRYIFIFIHCEDRKTER